MNSRDFVIKLTQFRDSLPAIRDKLFLDAVFSAAALVKARVIRAREKNTGDIFALYSPKYLKKRIKEGKGEDPRINFSFTAKMWQSTQPYITESSDEKLVVHVQPLDTDRARIMGFHDKRFGPILALNQEEIDVVRTEFAAGLQDHINTVFTK